MYVQEELVGQGGYLMDKKELLQVIEQATKEEWTELDLSDKGLTELPPEIGRLTHLTQLNISSSGDAGDKAKNQLTELPPEIGQLTNLTELDLSNNQLTALPPEIGQLTNLAELDLSVNQLTELPPEIGRLTNLTQLDVSGSRDAEDKDKSRLTTLPPEIGQLTNLTYLNLSQNELTTLPPEILRLISLTYLSLSQNELTTLPPEILRLTNLTYLNLSRNELTVLPREIVQLTNLRKLVLSVVMLPPEIAQLTNLTELFLHHQSHLTVLPPEITLLPNLTVLYLNSNQLTTLPPEIGHLAELTTLNLNFNQLTALPPEIGRLTKLTTLDLFENQLTTLPSELGQLTNLTYLSFWGNQLTILPSELSQLTNLEELVLDGNPLTSPPPEIVEQGTQAVLAYLQELAEGSRRHWGSKLLVVGEGGVGKTQVLRLLRGERFDPSVPTTHGIEIEKLFLDHPSESEVTMQLNAWDFGGQEIYHATHQFFLTTRSLFMLVWNARHGYEQGKLYYWLDVIQARAPESPVLLVATWIDERDADLPLAELRAKYPQIVGHYEISNKTGQGIEELRTALTEAAVGLPLMGGTWPANWLNAVESTRAREENHITPQALWEIMAAHEVSSDRVLARWLHELGDILYYRDDEELNDLVILKPQWVTEYISEVLESEEVIGKLGIFTRAHMDELWGDLPPVLRDHFLRLMEQFDLSYRTLENREVSLVVERLSFDPPDYAPQWDAIRETEPCREISMRFKLNTIPAGIPTWFIARSHRFTTHTHWRTGALFTDGSERRHLALARALPHERYLQLTVRGPTPHNFFALLKDGIEVTLARFPGLDIDRMIPCPGHNGEPCSYEFNYAHLQEAIERDPPIEHIQCPLSFELVSVPGLLFGLHWRLQDAVLERIDDLETTFVEGKDEILAEISELRALAQRGFTSSYRREQSKIESHCPSVFVLHPRDASGWKKTIIGQKIDLQLYCQAPGEWHPTIEGGRYQVDDPANWIKAVAPYLRKLVAVLKYAAPLAGPFVGVAWPVYEEMFKNDIKLMTELVKKMPDLEEGRELGLAEEVGETRGPDWVSGAALRALRQLLDEKDPEQHWGGLKKVLTPEGHYLWLCECHAQEYAL